MKKQGIYQIANNSNGNRYIGSSIEIQRRWTHHKSRLRADKHKNPHLQSAWNKYGEEAFSFTVLVETDVQPSALCVIEDMYLYNLEPEYNIAKVAGVRTMLGRKHTGETKAKMSRSATGKKKTPEHCASMSRCRVGKPPGARTYSAETLAMFATHLPHKFGEDSPSSKLTWDEVDEIRERYESGGCTHHGLAGEYGVGKTTIAEILTYQSWKIEHRP